MEALLEDYISPSELSRYERQYYEETQGNREASAQTRFEYAWALIRSKYSSDIRRGVMMLEDLCHSGAEDARRDYLFYLAVGNTKLKEYQIAQGCVKKFLAVEPQNRQALELKKLIEERMTKEGLMGMAIVGGAALALGGVIGLGMALSKRH